MYIVLCILLWLGAVNPNSSYTHADIESLELQYAPIISVVESTPLLQTSIEATFGSDAVAMKNDIDPEEN